MMVHEQVRLYLHFHCSQGVLSHNSSSEVRRTEFLGQRSLHLKTIPTMPQAVDTPHTEKQTNLVSNLTAMNCNSLCPWRRKNVMWLPRNLRSSCKPHSATRIRQRSLFTQHPISFDSAERKVVSNVQFNLKYISRLCRVTESFWIYNLTFKPTVLRK